MAFNILPIELNQEIAHYIEADKDLCAFAATCQTTHNAVHADYGSFWRRRFQNSFALAKGEKHSNNALKKKYQKRSKWLHRMPNFNFVLGHDVWETKSLAVIRELITESFTGDVFLDKHGRRTCRNLNVIESFLVNSRSLHVINHSALLLEKGDIQVYHWGLAAIQLMYAHVLFDNSRMWNTAYGFADSQHMVYADAKQRPIFTGQDRNFIDMEYILHIMNFFRYHLTRDDESVILKDAYDSLDCLEKPSAWDYKLEQHDDFMEADWAGTYAYLEPEEIKQIRKSKVGSKIFIDKNVDGSTSDFPIQALHLGIVEPSTSDSDSAVDVSSSADSEEDDPPVLGGQSLPPDILELFAGILRAKSKPTEARTRAQHRARSITPPREPKLFSLQGIGKDDGEFFADGWVHDLPVQEGIPGWKRATFMKYYTEDQGGIDLESLWAYEGVILPGGKFMMGRWWAVDLTQPNPEEDRDLYSGPFILWAVEPKVTEGNCVCGGSKRDVGTPP